MPESNETALGGAKARKRGAQPGNKNAVKHGRYCAPMPLGMARLQEGYCAVIAAVLGDST